MPTVVPTPFLFRFSIPIRKAKCEPTTRKKTLLGLTDDYALPNLREVEDAAPDSNAVVRACWSDTGFGLSITVSGKQHPTVGNKADPLEAEGIQVWIDTRDTKNIHRASRFCHHFCLIPFDSGKAGTKAGTKADGKTAGNKAKPVAIQLPIARAREESTLAKPASILMKSSATKDGYELEAWFPADVLHGYEPSANPRLGFYFLVRDSELGDWPMTVGDEFPYAQDPSLWPTLEMK